MISSEKVKLMKKIQFVVNPAAGNGRGMVSAEIIKNYIAKNNLNADVFLTLNPGDAIEHVANLSGTEYCKVIAVGGDGTVNEVVNGILSGKGGISLNVLPVGSGNDMVRMIGVPKKLNEALDFATSGKHNLTMDAAKVKYLLDDGTEKTRYFINSLGVGFDAQVAFIKSIRPGMTGIKAYIIALLDALKSYKAVHARFMLDDEVEYTDELLLLTIGNGVTSGGGFFLNPDAIIDDGTLNLTTINYVSKLKILRKLPLALINKIKNVPEAKFYTCSKLEIKLNEPYYVHVDGEVLSHRVISMEIEILKSAIKIN